MTSNFEWLAERLINASFVFAKSMPKNPHWYTLRKDWDDEDFVRAVEIIRKDGYNRRWYRKNYTSYNVNDHYYWTMGEPINKDGKPWTILINKAKRNTISEYDFISEKYDSLFEDDDYKKEDEELMSIVGYKEEETVLDIGCGTGLLTRCLNIKPELYTGIDKSKGMLSVFEKKSPEYKDRIINTEFECFYSGKKYDKIVALYGTASYIEKGSMTRIKSLLNDGGKAILMFYKNDYTPVTYQKTGVNIQHNLFEEDDKLFSDTFDFNNYIIAEIKK